MNSIVDQNSSRIPNQHRRGEVNTIILFSNSGDDAMSVLRVQGPARDSGLKVLKGFENDLIHLDQIAEADVVVLQRDFSRDVKTYEEIIGWRMTIRNL